MNSMQQIEGLLFVAGEEGISITEIAAVTGFERPAILSLLGELAQRYQDDESSALALMQTEDNYQLVTKTELAAVIHEYFTAPLTTALSQASLEVLAIVAYRQPITRVEVDEIRGVQSQGTLQKLVLRNLIESKRRSTEPGRPNLYETTEYFLNYFGLPNLRELPPLVDAELLESLKSQKDLAVPLMEDAGTSSFDLDTSI